MRTPPILALVLALACTVLGATAFAEPGTPPAYEVIVNPSNAIALVDRSFLEDAFLKKRSHWPNDAVIHPVDLGPESATRRAFSESVLRRSIDAVKGYWQQRIFSGRDVPPPELEADEDVVRYVLKYEGAVGYVSGGANLNGARVVTVR